MMTVADQEPPFRPLGKTVPHFWRVQRMAKATDIDLAAAMKDGRLSAPDWATMVTHCRGCLWTDGCARWLDRSALDQDAGAHTVPDSCRNKARFAALKQSKD